MNLRIVAAMLASAAIATAASAQDPGNMAVPEFLPASAQPAPAAVETPAPVAAEPTTEKERKAHAKKQKDEARKAAAAKKGG